MKLEEKWKSEMGPGVNQGVRVSLPPRGGLLTGQLSPLQMEILA